MVVFGEQITARHLYQVFKPVLEGLWRCGRNPPIFLRKIGGLLYIYVPV